MQIECIFCSSSCENYSYGHETGQKCSINQSHKNYLNKNKKLTLITDVIKMKFIAKCKELNVVNCDEFSPYYFNYKIVNVFLSAINLHHRNKRLS